MITSCTAPGNQNPPPTPLAPDQLYQSLRVASQVPKHRPPHRSLRSHADARHQHLFDAFMCRTNSGGPCVGSRRILDTIHLFSAAFITICGLNFIYQKLSHLFISSWHVDLNSYETATVTQATIYYNTRRKIVFLAVQMSMRGFIMSTTHAKLDQKLRDTYEHKHGADLGF